MNIWNLFAGYVIIEIKGAASEKLINSIMSEGYEIWNIKRIRSNQIRACVSVKTFFALRKLVKRFSQRCSVKLIRKHGLLFHLSALRERKLLLLGWLIPLAALVILSGSLWRINVTGCDVLDEELVYNKLKSNGVNIGMRLEAINTMSLANELCACDSRIAFASVCLKGVTLYVDIKESDESKVIENTWEAVSIYAKKDGIIRRIIVKNGLPMVNSGDAVKCGDELISGIMAETAMPVKAEGQVLAEVLYRCSASASAKIEKSARSGNNYQKVNVYLTDMLYFSDKERYKAFEIEAESKAELNGFFIPLSAQRSRVYEMIKVCGNADENEMVLSAEATANDKLIELLPKSAKLLSKQTDIIKLENGDIKVEITATTLEDIGTDERKP